MSFYPQPKPRPSLLTKQDRQREQDAIDRRESAKVKARANGRCEVRWRWQGQDTPFQRCTRPPGPGNHHLIYGIGVRNVGPSILAEHRIAVCVQCHPLLTHHVLVPVGPDREDAAAVRYERLE